MSSHTQNMAAKQGWGPWMESLLVRALLFDCCVILDKSLNLSGLFSSLYTKGLGLMTTGGCAQRGCLVSLGWTVHSAAGSPRNCSHLPSTCQSHQPHWQQLPVLLWSYVAVAAGPKVTVRQRWEL